MNRRRKYKFIVITCIFISTFVISYLTIKYLSKPDFKNPHEPLPSETVMEHFIPEDVEIWENRKWADSGRIKYLIPREFPPDSLVDKINQFYLSKGWWPLKYNMLHAMEKAGYLSGWQYFEYHEGLFKRKKDYYRWGEQYWINDKGQVIKIVLIHDEFNDVGMVTVTIDLYEPSFVKEPIDYYHKLHGNADETNNIEMLNIIKQNGYEYYLMDMTPSGPILIKSVTPYEKIPSEYLKLWLEK